MNKNPLNGRFLPGNQAARGKKLTPEQVAIRECLKQKIFEAIKFVSELTVEELEDILNNKTYGNFTLEQMGLVSAYGHYIKTGDANYVREIWNRVLGKPVESISLEEIEEKNIEFKFIIEDLTKK